MQYRREVDGLRALAVLPVMLFHAGFDAFSGGYVGVDVFFVISGYLISTIILSELELGTFSIVGFYERRARRIMPALFLVMLVCLPFAWLWFLPSDMKAFSQSLIAVTTFVSNILFWHQSGYFDTAAELKPLLHTWSLAVEEQFYVLFPLLLMLIWRFGKRWVALALTVTALLSLAIAQWASTAGPVANFYLLPSRVWELLLGALVAFYLRSQREKCSTNQRAIQELGGLLGLCLLLYSIFAFDQSTPFPSVYALAPTLGTALIILCASQETLVGRFLGLKALVGVGLVSYSAYLWHQPLFAFARYVSLETPSKNLFATLTLVALVLAYLSWRFVETPFRNKQKFSRKGIFYFAGLGSAFFISVGIAGAMTNGFQSFRPSIQDAATLDARLGANAGMGEECVNGFTTSDKCRTHESPETLVWGDSYAMHLVEGLLASNPEARLVQQTKSVCGPVLDYAPMNAVHTYPWSLTCMEFNDQVFEFLKNSPSIKYVVLGSAFIQYLGHDRFFVLTRDGKLVEGESIAYDAFKNTLDRIIALGKVPVLFAPPPQTGNNIGQCLANAIRQKASLSRCDMAMADVEAYRSNVQELLRALDKDYPVVWLQDELCSTDVCKSHYGWTLLYTDHGHFSREGSAQVGKTMDFYGRVLNAQVER